MRRYFTWAGCSVATLAASLACTPAFAQDVSPPTDTQTSALDASIDNDILVTARKRTETVQAIADPISVLTAKTIQNADLRTLQDAVRLTPNLVVLDGLYPGYKTVSFRGFTTLGRDGEFPFAQIIDGVVQPGQMNFQQELVNVQQIEVLRGPQGTLYGGGAIAGAINIVTREPTNDLEGSGTFQWLTGNEKRANVSLTGALIQDKLFFQAGVTAFHRDGLIDNEANPLKADFGKGITSRASIIAKPTEDLRLAATVSTTDSRVGGLWLAVIQDLDSVANPAEDQAGIVRTKLRNYSFKADYTIPDFATFTSITAYSRGRDYTTADGDFSPASINTQNVRFVDKAWSQEFRLTSDADGPFKWNVGFFYQDEKRIEQSSFRSVDQNPLTNPNAFNAINDAKRRYKTTALFGQASYELADGLEFTGGFRYDWERQTFVNNAPGPGEPPFLKQKFSEPQGKASLSYRPMQDLLTYVSYSRGYRKGGFNPRNTQETLQSYQPETADNYEIGFKSTLFDRVVTFNGALFYTNFNGQLLQTSRVLPGVGIFIAISNIEKTRVKGFEAETTVRVAPGFSLSGSIGYSDVNIRRFLPENPTAFRNNRTPQIYGFTSQIGADLDTPLTDDIAIVGHGDLTHRGSVYWDIANELRTGPRTFVNAKLGLRYGAFQLSFVGRNLTNERTPAAVGPNALGNASLASFNDPRQYGVELGVRF